MTDWKRTKLRARVSEGKTVFNPVEGNKNHQFYYREEEIDYMINMLKLNSLGSKSSHAQTLLQPIF